MRKPLAGRRAVVTGASRGIGYEIAKSLAGAGAHIIAVARTVGGLEDLDDDINALGGSATLVPVDLGDFEAIDRLGATIYERWGSLDILVGNAGLLGTLSPVGHIDPKVWDDVMAINLTANWRLIRSFDPLLRQSDAGRAVFVSSGAAHKCLPFWGGYSVSKAALEALIRTYAAENANTTLRVNMVNPGPLRTHMRAQAMPGEDPMTLKTPADLAPKVLAMCLPDFDRNGELYDFPTDRFLTAQSPS